ncbi:MAG: ATP synthase F1 subunit epsilon [Clostridia bacterium]
MEERKIHLRIITPQEVKVNQKADMVIFRCVNGDMGIMPGHEPISAVLGDGVLRIKEGETERRIAIFGGIVDVNNDRVSIMTSTAERPEDIDRHQAESDRQQAEMLLKEKSDSTKIQGYQALLRRALVRIEVSTDSIIDEDD